jgi:hypothetical protein
MRALLYKIASLTTATTTLQQKSKVSSNNYAVIRVTYENQVCACWPNNCMGKPRTVNKNCNGRETEIYFFRKLDFNLFTTPAFQFDMGKKAAKKDTGEKTTQVGQFLSMCL